MYYGPNRNPIFSVGKLGVGGGVLTSLKPKMPIKNPNIPFNGALVGVG